MESICSDKAFKVCNMIVVTSTVIYMFQEYILITLIILSSLVCRLDKQYIELQNLCILLRITCLYKGMGGIKQFTSVPCTPNMECIAHQCGVHGTPI